MIVSDSIEAPCVPGAASTKHIKAKLIKQFTAVSMFYLFGIP
jgi:hypothetical protein